MLRICASMLHQGREKGKSKEGNGEKMLITPMIPYKTKMQNAKAIYMLQKQQTRT